MERTRATRAKLGAMAGTVDLMQRALTGIEVTGDALRLNPRLPQELERVDLRISYPPGRDRTGAVRARHHLVKPVDFDKLRGLLASLSSGHRSPT